MLKKLKQILTTPVFKSKINYSMLNPANFNWEKIKSFLKIFVLASTAIFIIILIIDIIFLDFIPDESKDEEKAALVSDKVIEHLDNNYFTPENNSNSTCNVTGLNIHGDITTYIPPYNYDTDGNLVEDQVASENIVKAINDAEKNDIIKAIIVEIDTNGGSPVAAEEVGNALKKAKKPTVAYIRSSGTSAGYWIATGVNKIFASKNSDVGGIGVTISYLDNVKKNQKEGLTYNQLSTGKFKDTLDPDKILTTEEKNLIMRDVKIIHEEFIKTVASNRNLKIEKVRLLADGSSMPGQMALENGLIDQIGGMPEATEYLKDKIEAEVEVCWQ